MLEQIAHYKILDRIGAGGLGEVYRARDTRLGRTVAIKVLPENLAADPDRREQFLREAQAAAALSHPNIAALFEVGEDDGHLFLAFEYVPGQPLSKEIGGRPMNPRQAIHLAAQIADALADGHGQGIVHGDIKPDNVVVTPKGHAKVLDFGLARWTSGGADRERAATMLETGAAVPIGTVAYMSPEQAVGGEVGPGSDIFSLGVVLHEMLTGTRPFHGSTPAAVSAQIVQAQPSAPSTVNRNVPRELDAIVSRALAKSVTARYQSAAALAAELRALDAVLDVRSEALERAQAAAQAAKPTRAVGRWVALAIVVVLIGGALSYARAPIVRWWKRTVGARPQPIVAVIPLELADADRTQQFFADGVTEDLITRLGQTAGLKVIGRSATRAYRGRTPQELARELAAAVVLTGTVRRSGDTINLSLELVEPDDGTTIWTGLYTRELRDIFAIQAQVADDVATALKLGLTPTPARERAASRLVDPRAYEAYLRGRQAAAERNRETAEQQFQRAIQLDEGLAEAHAGLAEALRLESAFLGSAEDPARRAQIKKAAERAFELDPDLPQANLAVALTADSLTGTLAPLKKAIALDPTFSEGFHQIGDQILDFDPGRALAFYQRAAAIDPRMDANDSGTISALSLLGRFDEAWGKLASAGEAGNRSKAALRAAVALDQRRFDEAVRLFGDPAFAPLPPVLAVTKISTLVMVGKRDEALADALALNRKTSRFCELRAALAGLRQERGQTAAARQLAGPALAAAADDGATAAAVRCGVLAAAAIGDAALAASLLERIAGSESLLLAWPRDAGGLFGSKLLRRGMFPWTHVLDQPRVVQARRALDAAYATARQQIAAELDPITPK